MSNAKPIRALIRETAGLNVYERVFLLTVETHEGGRMFATVKTACRWMSMSRSQFYRARNSLLEKGLLAAEERGSQTTIYTVKAKGLGPMRHVSDRDTGVPMGVAGGPSESTGGVPGRQLKEELEEEHKINQKTRRVRPCRKSQNSKPAEPIQTSVGTRTLAKNHFGMTDDELQEQDRKNFEFMEVERREKAPQL